MSVVLYAVTPHPFLSPIQYSSFFSTLPLSESDPNHRAKRWGKVMHSRSKTATARPGKGRQWQCWRPREEQPRAAVSCGALPHLSCSADAYDPILHYQGAAIPFLFFMLPICCFSILFVICCMHWRHTGSNSIHMQAAAAIIWSVLLLLLQYSKNCCLSNFFGYRTLVNF
jgi:hypothetical protein